MVRELEMRVIKYIVLRCSEVMRFCGFKNHYEMKVMRYSSKKVSNVRVRATKNPLRKDRIGANRKVKKGVYLQRRN